VGNRGGPLCRRKRKPEGFFTKWCMLLGFHLPRRTDMWARLVRKRVNLTKLNNQCSLSRIDPNSDSYVTKRTVMVVFWRDYHNYGSFLSFSLQASHGSFNFLQPKTCYITLQIRIFYPIDPSRNSGPRTLVRVWPSTLTLVHSYKYLQMLWKLKYIAAVH
jgi:hypothetical protein